LRFAIFSWVLIHHAGATTFKESFTLNLVDTIPAIVRILLVFCLILVAIKRNWSLGNAFMVGSAALAVVFGMSPWAIVKSAGGSMVHPKTLSLTVVVSLILVFSHSLEKSGQMKRLLESFKGLLRSPRLNLVVFPALIGLLPMPGGAIFSAPMVKHLGKAHHLSGAQLSYINYWFRHVWEYSWPLYPGVLLSAALANVGLWHLVGMTVPLTLTALTVGYWPLRGAVSQAVPVRTPRRPMGPFIRELGPILLVILGGLGLGFLLSAMLPDGPLRPIAKELGLIVALMAAIAWAWQANALPVEQRWAIIRQPAMIKMIYMVLAILVFKGVLEDSQAVRQVSQEMLRWRVPLVPICMILPFLVGAVAGITIAFVGAAFPILVSLIHSMGQGPDLLPLMMLAMASGFVGVLISPLHLCLLLSNEYFHTGLGRVYRLIATPLVVILSVALTWFWIASFIF
jgi:hypothetical protein